MEKTEAFRRAKDERLEVATGAGKAGETVKTWLLLVLAGMQLFCRGTSRLRLPRQRGQRKLERGHLLVIELSFALNE